MSLVLTSPAALWLLAVLPAIWVAAWFSRTSYGTAQRLCQTAIRSLIITALALALARPTASWGTPRTAVVYAVDVSHSISSGALRDAAAKIDALSAATQATHARILVFGADVAVLPDTAALRALAETTADAAGGPVQRDASDLAQALDAARAELPPGFSPHVVLLSDGRSTSADVTAALTRMTAHGIPVSVEPLGVRDLGDTWIDAIELPDQLYAGSPAVIGVVVGSQRAARVTVELHDGDDRLAILQRDIARGNTVISLTVTPSVPGSQRLEARLVAAGDPLAVNNQLAVEAIVSARSRVLYVEGTPASAKYLSGALTQAGMSVTVADARGLVAAAANLDAWDLVVLSDLARASIPDDTMRTLSQWVEHDGGGVFFASGDAVFGEASDGSPAGYRHSELERVMPVTFERKDEPEVALVIVLDKSWSMEGGVMELCKAAALAAVNVMTPQQLIGIVTFDSEFTWAVPIRAIGEDREPVRTAIAGIQASGATRIFPALEQSYLELVKATARAKHVILLTDGRSYDADYQTLVNKMISSHITVSTVGVGPAVDRELLANIASWGKGRNYNVSDARAVQEIFVRETKDAAAPSFDEALDITPVVKTRAFLEGVNLGDMPPLRGRTGMTLKDDATEVLATIEGNPILAFWAVGSGRTAAFASDVKDRWAARWVGWRGYGPFFAATARALARQRAPRMDLTVLTTDVQNGRRAMTARVEARDEHGGYRDLLQPVLRVTGRGGRGGEVRMQQSAPGRYETTISAAANDGLSVSVTAPGEPAATRLIVPDSQAEYRLRAPDVDLLRSVAAVTGGTFQPSAADITRAQSVSWLPRRDLWPALVLLAFVLWFADIALRRFRFGPPRNA